MPPTKLTPLELGLIDEGLFLAQANADLMDCQRTLLEFRRRHGYKAEGAKCKLTIEIVLVCEKPDDELFSVKALTKKNVPARPASTSYAMSAETDAGEMALFIEDDRSNHRVGGGAAAAVGGQCESALHPANIVGFTGLADSAVWADPSWSRPNLVAFSRDTRS